MIPYEITPALQLPLNESLRWRVRLDSTNGVVYTDDEWSVTVEYFRSSGPSIGDEALSMTDEVVTTEGRIGRVWQKLLTLPETKRGDSVQVRTILTHIATGERKTVLIRTIIII